MRFARLSERRHDPSGSEAPPVWFLRSYRPDDARRHVGLGLGWLVESRRGEHTAALSYAALEFRFAIEALAVRYRIVLQGGRPLSASDVKALRSFKSVQQQIHELAGHQRQIDRHFEFMRIVLDALQITEPLLTPNVSRLKDQWHTCSECCHVSWASSSSNPEQRSKAFHDLSSVARELEALVRSLGWPDIKDSAFKALRSRYVAGKADAEDVREYLTKKGVRAKVNFNDGRPSRSVGIPIPPSDQR